jgi:hypothetical protein
MAMGNLKRDWTLVYASSGHTKRNPPDAHVALSGSQSGMAYFLKFPGAVYTANSTALDADILIGCEKDVFAIKPTGAKFSAFKKHQMGTLGFVLENVLGDLRLYDPEADSGLTATRDGVTYDNVGDHSGKSIFARLDRTAIKALHAGSHLSAEQLTVYENSMKKGVIPSGSTGSDGIKFDNNTWVIKITISMASANVMDNTLSPMADPVVEGDKIYLNFNQLTARH